MRDKPVQKIVSRIGELARRPGPPVIGVCGCVAEHEGQTLLDRSPAVGFVLGPGQVESARRGTRCGRFRPPIRAHRLRLDGGPRSSRRCFVRAGPVAWSPWWRAATSSAPSASCRTPVAASAAGPSTTCCDEVRELAARGLREVELLGQTINAYRCPVDRPRLRRSARGGRHDRRASIGCDTSPRTRATSANV